MSDDSQEIKKQRRGRPRKNPIDPNQIGSSTNDPKESNAKVITDPLLEPYFIDMDQYCFTVFEKITPENEGGKIYSKSVGHYSNLGSCLDTVIRRKTNNKSYESLRAYLDEFKQITNTLNVLRKI